VTTANQPSRLYAWYGDDFTGSTDVLEALALHGVSAVLFTHLPEPHELEAFAGCRAIGIAGESRSRGPHWMDENLPQVLAFMRSLGAPIHHYKVCSTFDSAPQVGSIGRAMELGRATFNSRFVPVVVGAPHLGRAVAFSNLFAAADGVMYRIDRHPTMSGHPLTPMTEADLRVHLSRQTSLRIGGIHLTTFASHEAPQRLEDELRAGADAIVFDGLDDAMLEETAQLLWRGTADGPVFAVGSSGLTHGLLHYWRKIDLLDSAPEIPAARPCGRLIVLSGSCSPVSANQIRCAIDRGFTGVFLSGNPPWPSQLQRALLELARGNNVVLYTALGPQPADPTHGERFGAALGDLLRDILAASGVRRVVIAGGDTSTRVVAQLDLTALTFAAPLTPGAPLCRGHAPGSPIDGLELVLKGGQIGPVNFFPQALGQPPTT